jgi:hypothetical protein
MSRDAGPAGAKNARFKWAETLKGPGTLSPGARGDGRKSTRPDARPTDARLKIRVLVAAAIFH